MKVGKKDMNILLDFFVFFVTLNMQNAGRQSFWKHVG